MSYDQAALDAASREVHMHLLREGSSWGTKACEEMGRIFMTAYLKAAPRPEEKTYILLATEKGLTPIGKLVDALTTFVKAEESFVASVKPGVIDDHLSEAYYKASAALKQFSMYTDNIAVSQPEPQHDERLEKP